MEMTDLTRTSRTRLTLDKLQYNLPLRDAGLHPAGAAAKLRRARSELAGSVAARWGCVFWSFSVSPASR